MTSHFLPHFSIYYMHSCAVDFRHTVSLLVLMRQLRCYRGGITLFARVLLSRGFKDWIYLSFSYASSLQINSCHNIGRENCMSLCNRVLYDSLTMTRGNGIRISGCHFLLVFSHTLVFRFYLLPFSTCISGMRLCSCKEDPIVLAVFIRRPCSDSIQIPRTAGKSPDRPGWASWGRHCELRSAKLLWSTWRTLQPGVTLCILTEFSIRRIQKVWDDF